jgi:hypothetical protein
MDKKTLFLGGLTLMVLGAYLYGKSKKVAERAVDSVGTGVADKVGDVTQTIIKKAMDGSLADTKTNSVSTQESPVRTSPDTTTLPPRMSPEVPVTPLPNPFPPRLAPLPPPVRQPKSPIGNDLELATILKTPRFNDTEVWQPTYAPITNTPRRTTLTVSDSFDVNNWQNMVN